MVQLQSTAEIEAMIVEAEAELAGLERRLERTGGPAPHRTNPFDRAGCLEIWLAALYASRDRLLRAAGPPLRPAHFRSAVSASRTSSSRSVNGR